MKVYIMLFILILNIIFAENTDAEGREDDNNSGSSIEVVVVKAFPEQTFSSSEESAKKKKDPFWGHPIVNIPPWISPDQDSGESRYPDPSWPIWRPSWKPNKKPKANPSGGNNAPQQMNDGDESFKNDPSNKQKLKHTQKNEEYDGNNMDEAEIKQYAAEIKAGDTSRLSGTNRHRYQPDSYLLYDLGRRFVPQYPYQEVNQNDLNQDDEDPSLIPKRASPELVLAIAKKAKLMQAAQPVDPNEHLLEKDGLRSGNYWNSYWKEDVDEPTNALRSLKRNKLDTVTAKLSPGTPIYEYVSKLNKLYPKLLYVINKTP